MQRNGPVLNVVISIPSPLADALQVEGQQLPVPVTGKILIDTGASRTCVDKAALAKLGINPIGRTEIMTPSGKAKQALYPATFAFPGTPLPTIEFSSVIGADLVAQNLIALLGRDVLTGFVYVYNGPGGYITLAY